MFIYLFYSTFSHSCLFQVSDAASENFFSTAAVKGKHIILYICRSAEVMLWKLNCISLPLCIDSFV